MLLLQAWFVGEKVGDGFGRTRREAQSLAAEGSIKNLASKFSNFEICSHLAHNANTWSGYRLTAACYHFLSLSRVPGNS